MPNEKRTAYLTEAQGYPQFNQIVQLNRLLSLYANLERNEAFQAIVQHNGDGVSIQYLANVLNTPESNVFKKVRPLRETGLVVERTSGRFNLLSANFDVNEQVEKFINSLPGKPPINQILADVAALSDPFRFLVWQSLKVSSLSPKQLGIVFNVKPEVISAALTILKAAHWVSFNQDGRFKVYHAFQEWYFFGCVLKHLIQPGIIKSNLQPETA